MTFELPTGETGAVFQCSLDLFEAIDTPNCKYAVLSTKVSVTDKNILACKYLPDDGELEHRADTV